MNHDVIIPTRASKGSAGLHLYSNIDVDIDINSIKKINTGIRAYLPESTSLIEPIKIKKRQKIAQLIVSNISYPEIKKVKYLKDNERYNERYFYWHDS